MHPRETFNEIRRYAQEKAYETCKDCAEKSGCSKLKMITDHSEVANINLE